MLYVMQEVMPKNISVESKIDQNIGAEPKDDNDKGKGKKPETRNLDLDREVSKTCIVY